MSGSSRLSGSRPFYHHDVSVAPAQPESLAERYERLARESDRRGVDLGLRALDVFLSGALLLASLPVSGPISLALLATGGRPLFYRGERVGRGGRVFTMLKFRTLEREAETRLGPFLGPHLNGSLWLPVGWTVAVALTATVALARRDA